MALLGFYSLDIPPADGSPVTDIIRFDEFVLVFDFLFLESLLSIWYICEAPDIFQKLKSLNFSYRQVRNIADVFRRAAKLDEWLCCMLIGSRSSYIPFGSTLFPRLCS